VPRATALLVGAAAWETAGRLARFAFLPPLTDVLAAGWRLTVDGEILGSLSRSLISLAVGYALATALGVGLGALMGRRPLAEHLLGPYVTAMLAAPNLAFVPVLAALLGTGRLTQVAVVFLYAFFVIVASTAAALRGSDPILVDMARSFGARERQLVWRVLLPGAAPSILAGLRVGVIRAVKGMVSGEMLIAVTGLGALARTYGSRFDAANVLAVLLVVVAVALGGAGLIRGVERRLTRWAEPEG
jgi:NitT/TauT family transport system permease protein